MKYVPIVNRMRLWLWLLAAFCCTISALAQTNPPARLALVSNSDEAASAADVLTAQLSGNPQVQLLERDQIAKVYQEQGLSAGNTDYLKLGQVLGADGLVLLDVTKEGTNQTLNVRLVAVKPGVVLLAERLEWPLKDAAGWAAALAGHLPEYLPKLTVLTQDAIPLSVVNLRSAIASADGSETERELKLLTIQRLSQEPQLFVLERQKMALLGREKDLKLDDSPFWNGAWLLDGVIDQNGYSKDTVTVNARLTPKSGAPLLLEASGSRTNLAEVINQLAAKVTAALKISPTAREWNAADEAAKYYDEAQWALRWGVYAEAESAADSAWALGKHDRECAMVRIRSYISGLPAPQIAAQGGFDAAVMAGTNSSDREFLAREIEHVSREYPAVFYWHHEGSLEFMAFSAPCEERSLDQAIRALQFYRDFSLEPGNAAFGMLSGGSGSNTVSGSDWYQLGLRTLTAASETLLAFNLVPNKQAPVADRLAELREEARSVCNLITELPPIHNVYFTGDRYVTYDELDEPLNEQPNIFRCELTWGSLWQENLTDELAMYRRLMASPVFAYIHNDFWNRRLQMPMGEAMSVAAPRLAVWNAADRDRIPGVWKAFTQELESSSNLLWQLEAKALRLADASDDAEMSAAFTNFFGTLTGNREELFQIPVEVLYLGWRAGDLCERMGDPTPPQIRDSLEAAYFSQYYGKLNAMDQDYRKFWERKVAYAAQLKYLRDKTPYDFQKFVEVFRDQSYTPAQAAELLPLLTEYESNLVAGVPGLSRQEQFITKSNLKWVELSVGTKVRNALKPPVAATPVIQLPRPAQPPAAPVAAQTAPPADTGPALEILKVDRFLPVPLDGLPGYQIAEAALTAHHWYEGRLVLDFQYNGLFNSYDRNGAWNGGTRNVRLPAIAILDPKTETWTVISCPEVDLMTQTHFYHHTAMLHGELYTSDGGQIWKYDSGSRQWQQLPVSDGQNYELFAVNDRLYGASQTTIFEITDGGKSSRILASTRRQPPVSALDSQDLGTPTLFSGPGGSLRVSTRNSVFTWTGSDWRTGFAAPPASNPGTILPDGVSFGTDYPACRSWLATDGVAPVFAFGNFAPSTAITSYARNVPRPAWKLPAGLNLAVLPTAVSQSDWYVLEGHSRLQPVVDESDTVVRERVQTSDPYNVIMRRFCPGLPNPQTVYLNFNSPDGYPPLAGITSPPNGPTFGRPGDWMCFANDEVFFGYEIPPDLPVPRNPYPGFQAGVWVTAAKPVETALAGQKAAQLAELNKLVAAREHSAKELLAKYDHNHNGAIDPAERREALDDPAFIQAELDQIDTNHDGWLEGPELRWFDVNNDHRLDQKERMGIDLAIHFLALKLLEQFDQTGRGSLDQSDYNQMLQCTLQPDPQTASSFQFPFADEDHNGWIDEVEIEDMLKRYATATLPHRLGPRGILPSVTVRRDPDAASKKLDSAVNWDWRDSAGIPFYRLNGVPPDGQPRNPSQ